MALARQRRQRRYDHRLRELVRHSGNPDVVAHLGVPRSTALGWLKEDDRHPFVTDPITSRGSGDLQAEILTLRARVRKLNAIIRLLLVLIRVLGIRFDQTRLPEGANKARVLQAIERSKDSLSLKGALRVLGLSSSRYHRWCRNRSCGLDDHESCPRSTPSRLTADEILAIKAMVESPDYLHVPTGRLAILAQRIGNVFASPTTWYKLIRERGWRRPRPRVYPVAPKRSVRASRPDEYWHVDTTLIKLLDQTKVYLHAVIDNFSRKILAWRVNDTFKAMTTVVILKETVSKAVSAKSAPTAVVDAGVENLNTAVDDLVDAGWLRRVVALKDVTFSNSMIEAWWRELKHQWLYLNTLDTIAAVERLVAFYVAEHNTRISHSAFQGETPEEMYAGSDAGVAQRLADARKQARISRIAANRAKACRLCQPDDQSHLPATAIA